MAVAALHWPPGARQVPIVLSTGPDHGHRASHTTRRYRIPMLRGRASRVDSFYSSVALPRVRYVHSMSGLGNLRAGYLPSFHSGKYRPWSPSLSSSALRGPPALSSERPCTFSWPTVHLRWPPALADKTGFDRRHSVSSVLFKPFSLSLFSLHARQRMSVCATLSSSVHGWIYHI